MKLLTHTKFIKMEFKDFKEGDIVYLETKQGKTWHTKGVVENGRFRALESFYFGIYSVQAGVSFGIADDETYILAEPAIINEYQIY